MWLSTSVMSITRGRCFLVYASLQTSEACTQLLFKNIRSFRGHGDQLNTFGDLCAARLDALRRLFLNPGHILTSPLHLLDHLTNERSCTFYTFLLNSSTAMVLGLNRI